MGVALVVHLIGLPTDGPAETGRSGAVATERRFGAPGPGHEPTMPEGHTIHRYARRQREDLVGRTVAVSSPQGRFAAGAQALDGQELSAIEPVGKHLFYRWGDGQILHVHLGLFGRFRTHRRTPPAPTAGTRLAMATDEVTIHLSGPTACELLTDEEQDRILARLGPDPLGLRASFDEFSRRLDRRTIAVAAALLDQKVVAGIGNVYRAEILFLAGISPFRPARELTDDERQVVWDLSGELLRRGARAGRIVTVEPVDVGARRRSDLDRSTRLYVYGRRGEPCRRCDRSVRGAELAGRKVWWCPRCQAY